TAPALLVNSVVIALGTVSDGACVSFTVMVCLQVELFPDPSVALQVMVVTPTGYGALSGCPSLRVPVVARLPEQLSTAVALPGLTVAEQKPASLPATTLAGQEIVGGVTSMTVTFAVACANA